MRLNQGTGDTVASQAYNELQPRAKDPFKILQLHDKTLVLDYNAIPETMSIDRATHAPITSLSAPIPANLQLCNKNLPKHQHGSAQGDMENVIYHNVRHIGNEPSVTNVLKWYGYGPEHDTCEPKNHIPVHFITRYCP